MVSESQSVCRSGNCSRWRKHVAHEHSSSVAFCDGSGVHDSVRFGAILSQTWFIHSVALQTLIVQPTYSIFSSASLILCPLFDVDLDRDTKYDYAGLMRSGFA
jgi:hypothetical protein